MVFPVSNVSTSAGFAHLKQAYLVNKGLDRLKAIWRFREVCNEDLIPKRTGKSIEWFRYVTLSAVTTPSVEGAIPTGGTFRSTTVGGDLSFYSSYLPLSTILTDIASDPIAENAAELLGEQAGATVDQLTRDVIDAESSSTNQALVDATNLFPTIEDFRASAALLGGLNVQPMENNTYTAIMHPYTIYDIVNDPSANGYADIFKYTSPESSGIVKFANWRTSNYDQLAGIKIVPTTNVYNDGGSPPKYRAYVFGKNGVGVASLSGWTPSKVTDPYTQSFSVTMIKGGVPSIPDPTGELGAIASYRFSYLAVVLDGPAGIGGTYRYKTLDCKTKLGV